MRQSGYEPRISFTVALLIVNLVVFLVQSISLRFGGIEALNLQNDYFALSLPGMSHGYIWQLLTFQFMHAGWLHLLCNSLAIFFFGRSIETALGGKKLSYALFYERNYRRPRANAFCADDKR